MPASSSWTSRRPHSGRRKRRRWAISSRSLKRQGIGIFLISHDIHDVFDLADRVFVMKNGKVVGHARTQDVTKDEVLGMIILGKVPAGAVPGPGAVAL